MTPPPPRRITDVYPSYSQNLLNVILEDYGEAVDEYLRLTGRAHYRFLEMFDHEPIDWVLDPEDVVVSCSLFFKPTTFPRRKDLPAVDDGGQIPLEELHRVPHPAFGGPRRDGRSFYENFVQCLVEAKWQGCRCVVFLASDLRCVKPILEGNDIRVVMMRHPSVGMGPGGMWRFMAFQFLCRAVYVQDTDRPFNFPRVKGLLGLLDAHPQCALARPLQWTGGGGEMSLILGNHFVVRPEQVDFDPVKSMMGYIALNLLTEDRLTTFTHESWQGRKAHQTRLLDQDYDGPKPAERLPGKCFPYYGFDERWLKEVVYPHFSLLGKVVTQISQHNADDLYQALDLAFQEEHGNVLQWPG